MKLVSSRKCFEFEACGRDSSVERLRDPRYKAVNAEKVLTASALLHSAVGHCEGFVNTVGRCIG